jgi:GT2 family glycosyltransferase
MTLGELLARASNDYADLEARYREVAGADLVGDPFRLPRVPLRRTASVIIGAYNARATLPAALAAIAASSVNRAHPELLEVIVVDDGSSDGTFEAARALAPDVRLLLLRQERRGLNHAHNTALAHASGDIVVFSDADVLQTPWALEAMLGRHEVLDGVVLVGFRYEVAAAPAGDRRPTFWRDFRHAFPGRPASMCRVTRDLRDFGHGRRLRMANGAEYDLPAMVVGAFFSLPLADLEQMGGCEERLVGYGCEDSLIGARAIALGRRVVPVYAAASAHVSHSPRDRRQSTQFAANLRTLAAIRGEPFAPARGRIGRARRRVLERAEHPAGGGRQAPPASPLPDAGVDPGWWCEGEEALGHWDRALAWQARWTRTAPDSPAPALAGGRILRKRGQVGGAVAALRAALREHPRHAPVECELGMAYAAAGDPERARRMLAAACEHDRGCFDAAWVLATPAAVHRARAAFHRAQGFDDAAAEDAALARVAAASR